MTLYTANLEIIISTYLLNGRNLSVKFLKIVAFTIKKGDGFFFVCRKKPLGC